jgi:hypothetical protein
MILRSLGTDWAYAAEGLLLLLLAWKFRQPWSLQLGEHRKASGVIPCVLLWLGDRGSRSWMSKKSPTLKDQK